MTTKFIFFLITLFSANALAAKGDVDADRIRSTDRTKTWTMPAATGTLATTGNAENFTNKTLISAIVQNYLEMEEDVAPSSPAAGYRRLYLKSDGKLYLKDSAGVEALAGGGGTATDITATAGSVLLGTNVQSQLTQTNNIFAGVAAEGGFATLNGAQTITQKIYNGGSAANSSKFLIPKHSYAVLLGLTRTEGSLTFATDQDKLYIDNGTSLLPVGGGGGSAGINLLQDYNAEFNGGALWSAILGAVTPVQVYGSQDQIFDSSGYSSWDSTSAGQQICSAAVPVGALGGTNGMGYIWTKVPSGTATHKFQIVPSSGSTVETTIESTTTAKRQLLNMPFAAGTTVRLCFTSVAANEPNIEFDHAYLGETTNIVSVENLNDWTSYAPVVSGITGGSATVTGRWRRVGDSIDLHIKLTNAATAGTGTGLLRFTMPNGVALDTTKYPIDSRFGILTAAYGMSTINYSPYLPTATSIGVSDAANYALEGQDIVANSTWELNGRFPVAGWSTNQSAAAANQTNFDWTTESCGSATWNNGNVSHTCKVKRDGSILMVQHQIALLGAPNTATLELTVPGGRVIDTSKLASGTLAAYATGLGRTDLVRGSGWRGGVQYMTTTTVRPTYVDGNGNIAPITQAAPGTFASGDYLVIYYEVPIVGWSENNKAPTLIGSVTSNSTGAERVERLTVANSGTASVTSQSGSWISSVSRSSAGVVVNNFASGTFSSAPSCNCNSIAVSAACHITAISSSAATVSINATTTGTATDIGYHLLCMGAR